MQCRVFKPSRRGWKSETWWAHIKLDAWARPQRFSLRTTDKRIAEIRLQEKASEYEKEAMGLLPPRRVRDALKTPLYGLLGEFLEDLKAKGRTAGTLRKYGGTLRILFDRLGWRELRDVSPRGFVQWRAKANLSAKSVNDLRANLATFFRWMKANGLTQENPLELVGRVDTRGSTSCRRALSPDEAARLLAAAPEWRAFVYMFALYTGLRRKELNGLRWSDISADTFRPYPGTGAKGAPASRDTEVPGVALREQNGRKPAARPQPDGTQDPAMSASPTPSPAAWEGSGPAVRVPASISKNRRDSVLPLHPELVVALRKFRPADAAEFQFIFRHHVPRIETLRKDLAAAGIPLLDHDGRRIDLHSLRVTFGTSLLVNGVHPRVAMELMRHSDIKLTTKLYTDPSQLPLSAGVAALPAFTARNAVPEAAKTFAQKHAHILVAGGRNVSRPDAGGRTPSNLQSA